MKTRILTSAVILSCSILILALSGTIVMPVAMGLFAACAVFEFFRCVRLDSRPFIVIPAYIIASIMPVGAHFAKDMLDYFAISCGVIFGYMLYLFGVAVFSHSKRSIFSHADVATEEGGESTLSKEGISFGNVTLAVVGLFYIATSFTTIVLLRRHPIDGVLLNGGVYLFVLVFVIAWVTDVFAYLVGSFCGRHRLIPEVSPKKSVEGAVGGIFGALVGCLVVALVIHFFADYEPNYPMFLLMGFVVSIISQIGDLIASLIKREYGIKDYGNILPGHGGILDRFDSILAVTTTVLLFSLIPGGGALLIFPS